METVALKVENLRTRFKTPSRWTTVVDGVGFELLRGKTTALVGESGCGKSATALSIMRLIDSPGSSVSGHVFFDGRDLMALRDQELEPVRGAQISMIFQDPLTSLNPALTVGRQITETLLAHMPMSRSDALRTAVSLLDRVGIPNAEQRIHDYPHHFSGGMRQRVLIAMAVICKPRIIIADEPTTALDVTIQAKILRLLHDLQSEMQASLLLITHDLGVVAAMADEVIVMYAGRIVERASVDDLFYNPQHPYTKALLRCVDDIAKGRDVALKPILGSAPDLGDPPVGCRFAPRCPSVQQMCHHYDPTLKTVTAGHDAACVLVGA